MIRKIDHIGIAVPDAERALAVFRDALGLQLVETEPIESQKLVSYHLRVGASNLELLVPSDPKSVIAKFLQKQGEGIHHLAFAVEGIEEEARRLESEGLQPLTEEPTRGAGGKRILFFHPRTTCGVLLELCE